MGWGQIQSWTNSVHLQKNMSKSGIMKMGRNVEKPGFLPMQKQGTHQLRSYYEADQRLCFRYTESIICHHLKSEISSF